jgi:predicted transcriptional regulator
VGVLTDKVDEGELELVAIKMPSKLKARIDAAAKATGNNRTQTMLQLMRHALAQVEAEIAEKQAEAKKLKGR